MMKSHDVSTVDNGEPDPRVAPFGYFGTDQLNVGMFRWSADTRAALARYVAEDLLGGLLEDDENIIGAVTSLYAEWEQAGTGLDAVVAELNALTGDLSTIVWCGSFDDLARGDGEFAREVREAWRESSVGCSETVSLADGEAIDGSIAQGDLNAFVRFLDTYGY